MARPLSLTQIVIHMKSFIASTGLSLFSFLCAIIFAFIASLLEGMSLSLLIPLIEGMLSNDFSFVMELPVLSEITTRLPSYFPLGNRNFLIFLLSLTFFISVLKIIFQYISSLIVSIQLRSFSSELRQLVFQRYLSFGKLFFDTNNQGELHQIITNYVNSIASALQSLHSGFYAITTLTIYIIMMFTLSWKLTIIVLAIFPVLHLALRVLIGRIGKTSRDFAESFNQLGRKISNALSTLPLIHAYRTEQREVAEFRRLSQTVEYAEKSLDRKNLLINPLQELISLFFLFLLVGIICYLISLDGNWDLAGYMVFLVILRRSAVMFGVFNNMRNSLALVSGPLEHVVEIFHDDRKYYVTEGSVSFTTFQKAIAFQNLTYAYPECPAAIEDVSFTIEKGKVTALVGESGAGKSTLMNLFIRFYDPPPGSITVDGNDILSFSLDSWRSAIGYIPQEALLFHGTLRENICYGHDRILNDAELAPYLTQSRLEKLVERLPQGLETLVGDRGVKLSGGEKQRVAITRALIKNPPILLLDEATSALDSQTERSIQEALSNLMSGKTTLVIAHRLSTIKDADNIVVLEHGKVRETGTLDDLLGRKGLFFSYWEAQKFF